MGSSTTPSIGTVSTVERPNAPHGCPPPLAYDGDGDACVRTHRRVAIGVRGCVRRVFLFCTRVPSSSRQVGGRWCGHTAPRRRSTTDEGGRCARARERGARVEDRVCVVCVCACVRCETARPRVVRIRAFIRAFADGGDATGARATTDASGRRRATREGERRIGDATTGTRARRDAARRR